MEPKICRREVRAASGPVHHLTPSPTSRDSVTKLSAEETGIFFKLRNCLLKTQSSSVSCVGPVPYLDLFWAGPVKKVTL